MNPLVSVVILSWNRCDDVRQTLEVLMNYDYVSLDVIVVDNASSDGTVDMIFSEFPDVCLIALEKNTGVAGFNRGFEKATGEYILVLDDDSFPASEAIFAAVRKFEENPRLGIAAFKIINYHSGLCTQTREYERIEYVDVSKGIPAKRFVGCGAMIRRDLLEQIGYYPEDFFLYGNEADLALRAIYAGYEVRYFPDLVAFHKVSPKGRSSGRSVYFGVRNTLWLFWKYSSLPCALLKTGYFLPKTAILAVRSRTFGSYAKGLWDGLVGLPTKFRSRQVVYTQTIRSMLRSPK